MENVKLTSDLKDMEKKLTEICQNVIEATINHQKEEIAKQLELQRLEIQKVTNSPLIKLNIGGKKFTTTLATLTSFPESKLAKMFTGALPIIKDEKGVYFIDRNGDYFTYILDYLRDKTLHLPNDSFLSKKIKQEMQYYELVPQVSKRDDWTWDSAKQSGITMSNDNMTITKVGATGCGITIGTELFESGIYKWKIRINSVANHYWISTGIFDEVEVPFSASFNYSNCWAFTSYGEISRMTGTGQGIMLSAGHIYEMEYDADTGEFTLEIPDKNVRLKGTAKGQKMRAYAYVWTVGDSVTLEFD